MPESLPLMRVADAWRLARRQSLARSLAWAAIRDPRAFWITSLALRRYRALQKPLELYRYVSFLRRRRITSVMEIGTLWGGSFYAHAAIADARALVISLDRHPGEDGGGVTDRLRRLAKPRQEVICIWQDSHAETAVTAVESALAGRSLDLLFIDGDHSLAGVAQDYQTFSPFVRAGGVIAFHDIAATGEGTGMAVVWRGLRARHRHVEFIDRHPPHGLGIGVLMRD